MSDLRLACDQKLSALGLMPPPESQAPHKNIDYPCPLEEIQHKPRFQCDLPSLWGREEARPLSMQVLLLKVDAGKVWCRKSDRQECTEVLLAAFECDMGAGIEAVGNVVEEVVVRTGLEVRSVHRIENKNKYIAHEYLKHISGTAETHVVYHATTLAGAFAIAQTGLCRDTHASTDVWETLDRAKPEHGSLLMTFVVGTCVRNEHVGANGTCVQASHDDQIYPRYIISVRSVRAPCTAPGMARALFDTSAASESEEDLTEHMEFYVGNEVEVVKSALATFFCVGAKGVIDRIVRHKRRVHYCVRLHDAQLGTRVQAAAQHFKYPWLHDWTLLRCQWSHLTACVR